MNQAKRKGRGLHNNMSTKAPVIGYFTFVLFTDTDVNIEDKTSQL